MYVNLMGDVLVRSRVARMFFLTGVRTKHEYLQGVVVECLVALLVLFVTSLDVACVGDFAWPCSSGCGYAPHNCDLARPLFSGFCVVGCRDAGREEDLSVPDAH